MKVILPLKDIPDGSIVTKITGNKEYIIRSELRIIGDENQIIHSNGVKFLIPQSMSTSSISAINWDKEMIWHVEEDVFFRYMNEKYRLYS